MPPPTTPTVAGFERLIVADDRPVVFAVLSYEAAVPDSLEPEDRRVYIRVDRSGGRSGFDCVVTSSPRADNDRTVVRVVEGSRPPTYDARPTFAVVLSVMSRW